MPAVFMSVCILTMASSVVKLLSEGEFLNSGDPSSLHSILYSHSRWLYTHTHTHKHRGQPADSEHRPTHTIP